MSRFTARRALAVGAWAGAALTWAMALLGEPAGSQVAHTPPVGSPTPAVVAASTIMPAVPSPPDGGLVILRFTPVPPPPPEVVVRTVQAPAARQAVVVTSQGS